MSETELNDIWERISAHVRTHTSKDTFQRWFSAAKLEGIDGGKLTVSVPNQIYQFWIESNYLPTLKLAAAAVTGEEMALQFRVARRVPVATSVQPAGGEPEAGQGAPGSDESSSAGVAANAAGPKGKSAKVQLAGAVSAVAVAAGDPGAGAAGLPGGGGKRAVLPAAPALVGHGATGVKPGAAVDDPAVARRLALSNLNGRYAFGSFVVGKGNEFAHAASAHVAKCPTQSYNPLFIYGGVGLGKTHLMQAIGREIIETKPKKKVLYVTTEDFVNAFIAAVADGSIVKLRKRYRQVDVLLIDDIQFLAGKGRSQEEFFHTFNALSDGNRQIVLTSDRPPSEIATLEERLVSRFEWGLTAHLEPPDIETRTAILQTKMAALGVSVEGEVVDFIAQHVRSNVRRLEGALMRVASLSSLYGRPVSIEEAEEVLRDVIEEEVRPAVTIDRVQRKVAEHFDIRMGDMTSKRRPAAIAFPRQIAMYLSRELTDASYSEIGEAFGGRNHGTVMHACRLVEKRMAENDSLRRTISQLTVKIQGDAT